MSALVPLDDAHRNIGGFMLVMTRCHRPTCNTPIVRIALHEHDEVFNSKWCSRTCSKWGNRSRKASPIVMVSGQCPHCRTWFTRPERQSCLKQTDGATYCSDKCKATSKWPPCGACDGKNLRRPADAVCSQCFYVVSISCAGKARFNKLDAAEARVRKFNDKTFTVYTCRVCNTFHVGSGDAGDNRLAADAATLLRQRLGPDRWNALVEQWASQTRSQARSFRASALRHARPASRGSAP